MSALLRVLAGSILVLGLTVAIAIPNGHVCGELDAVEAHRHWSFGQERWFYGCFPSPEMIEREVPLTGMRMGAESNWRIPLRVGVAIGLILAWSVVALVNRRVRLDATGRSREPWTADRWTRILLAVYALFGATIAVLVTLRHDEYWVRGTIGPSFSTRSFLGWDMTPVLAETLVAVVGAAGGVALGLLVASQCRRLETTRAMTGTRA